jgi:hypothetical protein
MAECTLATWIDLHPSRGQEQDSVDVIFNTVHLLRISLLRFWHGDMLVETLEVPNSCAVLRWEAV